MTVKIDYQKELNPSQLEAVMSTEGPHLIIAGAGSGKTRVLTYRVAYLVERGLRPEQILLLTFTRKAAEEMLRRASLILDERCARVSGGTFHSFANMTLRRYCHVLGFSSNFTILDTSDAEDVINLLRAKLGYHKVDKRFPKKNSILDVISKSVNKSRRVEEVLVDEYPQFEEWVQDIKRLKEEYAAYKYANSLLDYDDLLVFLKKLLSEFDDIRARLADNYSYVMVDEYQDTNKLQAEIAYLLSGKRRNIMVVGDDSQSIYSFRGANFRNIIDFPKVFADAKVITLEENSRSSQPILNLTNEIIRQAREKFEKKLFSRRQGQEHPLYVETADEHEQSEFVADRILELREEGISLREMAVLFRSGWHSNDLEIELSKRNIPFRKYGGQKFVEASHIKDILSYLKVTYNISDQVSWHRLLLLLPKIGPKTAEKIIEEVITLKRGLSVDLQGLVFQKNPQLAGLFQLLTKALSAGLGVGEMFHLFLGHYQPLLKEKYDDFHKRGNDLDSLYRIAIRYKSLEQFLTDMALEPPEKSLAQRGPEDKEEDFVTLSTIHSAKGLEWKSVFIIHLAEGHLPSYLSLEDEDQIEEERRLFYVASTRAKDNLFLIKPRLNTSIGRYFDEGRSYFNQTSRFLDEGRILDKFVSTEVI